jgi:hypothetical protein
MNPDVKAWYKDLLGRGLKYAVGFGFYGNGIGLLYYQLSNDLWTLSNHNDNYIEYFLRVLEWDNQTGKYK